MMLYQCQICKGVYGRAGDKLKLMNIKPFPKIDQHYADCEIWRCPHCNTQQDSRDLQPFLGVRGGNSVKYIKAEDILDDLFWNEGMPI